MTTEQLLQDILQVQADIVRRVERIEQIEQVARAMVQEINQMKINMEFVFQILLRMPEFKRLYEEDLLRLQQQQKRILPPQ